MQLFPSRKLLSRAGAGIYIKIIACPCPEHWGPWVGTRDWWRRVRFHFVPMLKDCCLYFIQIKNVPVLLPLIFTHAVRIDIDESPFSQDANMDKYIQLIRDEDVATKGAVLKTFGAIFENRRPASVRQQYKKEQAMINSDVGGSAFQLLRPKKHDVSCHNTKRAGCWFYGLCVRQLREQKSTYICNEIFTEPFKHLWTYTKVWHIRIVNSQMRSNRVYKS